jgi:hypothetical protein
LARCMATDRGCCCRTAASFAHGRGPRLPLQAELTERSVKVDYRAIWTFVLTDGLSFKKNVLPSEQERPDIAVSGRKKYQGTARPQAPRLPRRDLGKQHGADPGLGFARTAASSARPATGKLGPSSPALRSHRCALRLRWSWVQFTPYVETFLVPTLGQVSSSII